MYWCAHKTATLTSIQHTGGGGQMPPSLPGSSGSASNLGLESSLRTVWKDLDQVEVLMKKGKAG